jgi:hypothetical protein
MLANQAQAFVTPGMLNEMAATGGVVLIAIAFDGILEIKPIRSGNFLPAIFLAPFIVLLFKWIGI